MHVLRGLVLLIFSCLPVFGDEFPELPNTESTTDADPPSAEESAKSFSLPDGFGVSVWAGEPAVQNPIGMAWDHKGRMWVAENYTYAKRGVRFEMNLRDRVVVLADEDGDGKAEFRKVFTDKVKMLTSVEVGHGGVWLMCPPNLLFIPDADGDLVPDGEPEVMLDGFEVGRGNYHNFANGLRWGPDGWLYGRCGHSCPGKPGVPGTPVDLRAPIDGGVWRYHPKRKVVEVLTHGTVNPWGYDWDEHGELFFINTVIGHLWHVIPGAHYRESGSGSSQNPLVYERLHQHADHFHYDVNLPWSRSRAGAANGFGGGHAHVGMAIYQADHFPKYWRNKLLTWNQHGRRLNVERLEREGSGYVGKHEPDAFLNSDEWFRGMEVSVGPDGAIYGLDWSDTGECHDHTGVHRTSGRIYKFFHKQNPVADLSALQNAADEPEAVLRHSNEWFARQWLRALSERRLTHHKKTIQVCQKILGNEKEPAFLRLRALWALQAMELAKPEALLEDPDEHIRTWAIRLLTDEWPIDSLFGPRPKLLSKGDPKLEKKFVQMAKSDPSGLVRLALASTLQRLSLTSRAGLASALASRAEDADDHNLPMMVWFGIMSLAESDPGALIGVARATKWTNLREWIARSLADQAKERPGALDAILSLLMEQPAGADSLLLGMEEAFRGVKKVDKPKNWDKVREKLGKRPGVLRLSAFFGDRSVLEDFAELVGDAGADSQARREALQALIDDQAPSLRKLCEGLLVDQELNLLAARGLAKFEDPEIGKRLVTGYARFREEDRAEVLGLLCGRTGWARALLEQIEGGRIPKSAISAFHARQILALRNPELEKRLQKAWGQIRTTSEALAKRREELGKELNPGFLAQADLKKGRTLYEQTCASCHVMYGHGGQLGPDLTGSGRSSLDYILENVVDPGAVVSADYRMTILRLKDGRILSGMESKRGRNGVALRMPGSETVVEKSTVVSREVLPNSLMPAGLLDALTKEERRDLVAYLMHPVQVD
jgi:putative membrane-bound dehydrogenase-like protein